MPSLLDFLGSDDAQLGLGLLAAAGPSTQPASFGQRLAQGVQFAQANKDATLRRGMLQSQIAENASQADLRKAQIARAQALADAPNTLFGWGVPAASGAAPAGGGQMPAPVGSGMAPTAQPGATASTAIGSVSPGSLKGVPLGQVTRYKMMGGPDLTAQWKLENIPTQLAAGGYTQLPGQAPAYLPDPTKGVDFRNGVVSRLDGSSALASLAGEQAGAVAAAKAPTDIAVDRQRQLTQAGLDTQPYQGPDGNMVFGTRLGNATAAGSDAPRVASPNPITQDSAKGLNDNWIKNAYQPTIDAGKSAADISSNIQALRNIDMNTGWGTEAKATGAAMLEGLGVAPSNAKLFAANSQKFQSVAMDRLMTVLQAQKGMQTEGDASRAKSTFVSLGNTPDANAFIMDLAQAKANQDQRRAQFYEAALPVAQKAGDLTRVDREWRKIQGSIWADPTLQRWSK